MNRDVTLPSAAWVYHKDEVDFEPLMARAAHGRPSSYIASNGILAHLSLSTTESALSALRGVSNN